MNKKGSQPQQTNMAEDIIWCIQELMKQLAEVTFLLLKFGGKFVLKRYFKVRFKDPIVMKDLKSKKKDDCHDTLGWMVKASNPLLFDDMDTRRHTMIIGSTGYGKTNLMTLMHERSTMKNHSIVFFDPKASYESMQMFKEACEITGKKVYFFNEFAPIRHSFNPLLDGNTDQITDRIVSACNWSDEFYKSASVKALKEVVHYLKSQGEVVTIQKICDLLEQRKDQDKISGLIYQLESVNMSEFSEIINDDSTETLSFSKLREENACLYIGISSLGYSDTAKFLNKLFLDNLLYHCYESLKVDAAFNESRRPMSVYFDELGSIINHKFIELQNKCRAADIEITYATQCPADLQTVSGPLCDQVFENTENLFVFKQKVPNNVDYITQMIGTVTDEKKTYHTDEDKRTGVGSIREVDRLELHPSILRNLPIGKCVYLNKKDRYIDILNVRKHERRKPKTSIQTNQETQRSAF